MVFKSKIDAWLVVLIAAAVLFAPVMILTHPNAPTHPPMNHATALAVVLLVTALPGALIVWLFRTTDYTITETELHVRSGPISVRVPLSSVRKISATRSILSAPALSLDRLEIGYGKYDAVVISPEDKQGFVNEMVRRVPAVVLVGIDS